MSAVAVLTQLGDALNEGRFDVIDELSDDPRFRESLRRMVTAFPDIRLDTEWTLSEGHRAMVWTTLRGTHQGEWRGIPPTGKPVEYRGMLAIEVDDADRITDFWVVNDWLSLALQLGATLVPPSP